MTDIKIEEKWQRRWQEANLFQSDPNDKEKMYVTVAYPYPSGAMHVGHGRTYTVPDVYSRFKRMQGYNVLFPMGWHVTGAPVIGIAKRIKRKDQWTMDIYKNIHKVPEDELKKFTDPEYIVEYFSSEYHDVMTRMGYSIDWRREFKTLDPHYQKFIEWQFRKLKQKDLVRIGEHPVKYCPECENPVGDHDLLEGEGVGINELTLVKFEVDGNYLVAATFRPETLFGATNIWLNPESEYIRIKVDDEEWIIAKEAYDNLLNQKSETSILGEVDPNDLIGKLVKNPLTGAEHIILPASFVDPEYGTGVVYSVPGHAPADLIALLDLKNDEAELEKYDIQEEVHTLAPVGIIKLEGFGDIPAEDMLKKFDVKYQNDPNLKEATNEIYKLEHAKGVMDENTGEYSGLRVADAREKIIKLLTDMRKGDLIYEFAERPVICRCGTKCVVKILDDQWFLKYSDEGWKKLTYQCLEGMNIIPEEIRANFEYYIGWLQDWACSRRIGLGTKLPWNKDWLIEPLSDSTIYMAYYTIAKYMKDIDPEDLNDEFFDEIFLDPKSKQAQNIQINQKLTEEMKNEFNYWYPLDWRLSAKDLVGNHLSFHLFHHSAIFPRNNWPGGIVVFGMGLLEGNKMSSSKGNIVMLEDAIDTYGSDVVRLFLMSSAEPWQDFDWRENEVKGVSKRLEWFFEFSNRVEKIYGNEICLEDHKIPPEVEKPICKWMLAQVNMRIKDATEALEGFQTRKALQDAFFLFKKDIDHFFYRIEHETEDESAMKEVAEVLAYVLGVWIRLMVPFVPHGCEELWENYKGNGLVSNTVWPEYNNEVDEAIQKGEEIVHSLSQDINEIKKVVKIKPNKIHVYVAPEWKWQLFDIANKIGKPDIGRIMQESMKQNIHDNKKEIAEFAKKIGKEMTKIKYVGNIDEYSALSDSIEFLTGEADAEVIVYNEPTYDPKGKARNAMPYKPAIYIE